MNSKQNPPKLLLKTTEELKAELNSAHQRIVKLQKENEELLRDKRHTRKKLFVTTKLIDAVRVVTGYAFAGPTTPDEKVEAALTELIQALDNYDRQMPPDFYVPTPFDPTSGWSEWEAGLITSKELPSIFQKTYKKWLLQRLFEKLEQINHQKIVNSMMESTKIEFILNLKKELNSPNPLLKHITES